MTAIAAVLWTALVPASESTPIDLARAVVVTGRPGSAAPEQTAIRTLIEEAQKRTGIAWKTRDNLPETGPAIVAAIRGRLPEGATPPILQGLEGLKAEGYRITVDRSNPDRPVAWIIGQDARGLLFGVGKLLRTMELLPGSARLDPAIDVLTSPAYPIRGHQLGYRNRANSWDAWTVEQMEQYIRDLALFGSNCVENIPFEDSTPGVLMKVPRPVMNRAMSAICARYDLDHWLWTPADYDLNDPNRREAALKEHEALYQNLPRLDGVFVPGGDPGHNPPGLVLPFLEDLARLLAKSHPRAKVWLSLQGFEDAAAEQVYQYLDDHQPDWFGGIVCGPSSPSIPETRKRLNPKYPIRHYPDITHNVRAQYPVPWLDPAIGFTLGREAINPRPLDYARIHNLLAPCTAGFLSYSDGVHDDVNKVLWSALAWDPETPVREILVEYARLFFGPAVAQDAADGILALERNWQGSLRDNGGVAATLALWEKIDAPGLRGNWRWQMCQVRAAYDAYVRERLRHEEALETDAIRELARAEKIGAVSAMDAARTILRKAETEPVRLDLRRRIDDLAEALFQSIGLQTSMEKYHASGPERGCILDYVDHPLNNRWWLEDQFTEIAEKPDELARLALLHVLKTWEHPGPGSFYDQVGNVGKAPHVITGDLNDLGIGETRAPLPEVLWWEQGKSRQKPAWMLVMNWPIEVRYTGLDRSARYVVRTTGKGTCLMSINGEKVAPTIDGRGIGEIKEFPVPPDLLKEGTLRIRFERPVEHVNWREQSRLSEIWLMKR